MVTIIGQSISEFMNARERTRHFTSNYKCIFWMTWSARFNKDIDSHGDGESSIEHIIIITRRDSSKVFLVGVLHQNSPLTRIRITLRWNIELEWRHIVCHCMLFHPVYSSKTNCTVMNAWCKIEIYDLLHAHLLTDWTTYTMSYFFHKTEKLFCHCIIALWSFKMINTLWPRLF